MEAAKIRIISEGHPSDTKVIWIPTGEIIPVRKLTYTIAFDEIGVATLEISGLIELDVKATGVLHQIHNAFEMKKHEVTRIH